MTKSLHPREWFVLVFLVVSAVVAIGVGLTRRVPRPPDLSSVPALLAARDYDRAERMIQGYLVKRPENPAAHVLMAQVALARDVQKPALALEHLDRVKSFDRRVKAVVELNRGKAYSSLARHDQAEDCWKRALELDPNVPEAGWALLGLYYVQSRRAEAHALALELQAREPDPRDRVQLLLELIREDVQPLGAESTARTFEPVVRDNPGDLHSAIALGRALVKINRADEGIGLLRDLVSRDPLDPASWEALLLAEDDASRPAELERDLARIPQVLAADPRFASPRGAMLAQRGDWKGAAVAYRAAMELDASDDRVHYRLARALKNSGDDRESEAITRLDRARRMARQELTDLYEQANRLMNLTGSLDPELCLRLAAVRDRMGRADEADRWRGLATGARG